MRIKRRATIIITLIIILSIIAPLTAGAAFVGDTEISSKTACVINFDTGELLYGHAESELRVPASMTKILAAYLIYEADRTGELKLSSSVKISKSISEASYNKTYSNVPLPEGISVKVSDLLEVVMIRSACAATDALAIALCGSVDVFVARMNKKIKDFNINAQFYDTYGASPDNRISARGMAALTMALIRDYPEVLNITSKKTVTFRGVTYNSSNLLLGDYDGLDGFKTGYTDPAGYCFIGTAKRDGHRIIAVTMGSSLSSRYPDTRALLNYGFNSFKSSIVNENPAANGNSSNNTNPGNTAAPSSHLLTLDGTPVTTYAYNIGGNNFFKLRDIAAMLTGTASQFEVTWLEETQTVSLQNGLAYTAVGGELEPLAQGENRYARTSSKIIYNGTECEFDVYNIGGNNYFMLRDLASLMGFGVGWDAVTKTINLATKVYS